MIHKQAIIDSKAKIDEEVSIGAFSVIGAEVEIKKGTVIHSHVVIEGSTKIGLNNEIFQFSSLGGDPQDKKYKGEKTFLEIGDENIIREGVTINRGTIQENDCCIKDEVVMVNNAALAGCVVLKKGSILGGFSLVHQFCNIGEYSFTAMGSAVTKDIPAFVRVSGNPAKPRGLNTTGIQRLNSSKDSYIALKEAYKILYLRKIQFSEAVKEIRENLNSTPEVKILLRSLSDSKRGIIR